MARDCAGSAIKLMVSRYFSLVCPSFLSSHTGSGENEICGVVNTCISLHFSLIDRYIESNEYALFSASNGYTVARLKDFALDQIKIYIYVKG